MISFCLGKDKKNSGEIGFKFNHLGMKIHKIGTKYVKSFEFASKVALRN